MPIPVGSNLDLGNLLRVRNALDPLLDQDYATKIYVDTQKYFNLPCCRNATISSDQALRRQNGTFLNLNPYIVPYDATIFAMTAENNPTSITTTWDLVLQINTIDTITLSVPNTDHKAINDSLNVNVNQGDEIIFFLRNASAGIPQPGGMAHFIGR